MRFSGQLVEWNDARGFGFVQADGGGDRLFVHISAWNPQPSAQQRPYVGMPLTFEVGVEQGKKRARSVVWRGREMVTAAARKGSPAEAGTPQRNAAPASGGSASSSVVIRYGALLVGMLWLLAIAVGWGLSLWVLAAYAVLSLWCFVAYAYDKGQAQRGGWRTPEARLHALALLGGWPGALLAQQWLRHKTSKAAFRSVFWCTVAMNLLVVLWLHAPWGLQRWMHG